MNAARDVVLDDSPSRNEIKIGLMLLGAIDLRANTAFRYYETGSPFEYSLVRYLFREKRKLDISTVRKRRGRKVGE
jgi:phospholipid-binding lipoprotein MlaA